MSKGRAVSRRYKLIDHPTDLVIEVEGNNLNDLFAKAGFALCDQLCEVGKVESVERVEIDLSADSIEQLMVRWLSELLYQFEVHQRLLPESRVEVAGGSHLKGWAAGEGYDAKRHELYREIKAVTYHDLKIEQSASGWKATILFDL